jgi:hypothetical protein
MKHFKSRWPNVSYEQLVQHYGANPIPVPRTKPVNELQDDVYEWLRENEMIGTFVGAFPGALCFHVEGESNRLMFQLRWA